MLARNGDIHGVAKSMKQMEDRFNKRFRYPYVFLNEEPFTDHFMECVTLICAAYLTSHSLSLQFNHRRVTELTDSLVEFGLIPPNHWHQPDWIDEEKASAARAEMEKNRVIYGGTYETYFPADTNDPFLQVVYRKCGGLLVLVEVLTPQRYRNMCRFNSGVSKCTLLPDSLTYWSLVLLQA